MISELHAVSDAGADGIFFRPGWAPESEQRPVIDPGDPIGVLGGRRSGRWVWHDRGGTAGPFSSPICDGRFGIPAGGNV
jgi:hypothetical protein